MASVVVSLLHSLRSLVRSRASLHLEILALRHQLTVVHRSRRPRLRLTSTDRMLWAWLSRAWPGWQTVAKKRSTLTNSGALMWPRRDASGRTPCPAHARSSRRAGGHERRTCACAAFRYEAALWRDERRVPTRLFGMVDHERENWRVVRTLTDDSTGGSPTDIAPPSRLALISVSTRNGSSDVITGADAFGSVRISHPLARVGWAKSIARVIHVSVAMSLSRFCRAKSLKTQSAARASNERLARWRG